MLWDMPSGAMEATLEMAQANAKRAEEDKKRAVKILGIRERRCEFLQNMLSVDYLRQLSMDHMEKPFLLIDDGAGLSTYTVDEYEGWDGTRKMDAEVYAKALGGVVEWVLQTQ